MGYFDDPFEPISEKNIYTDDLRTANDLSNMIGITYMFHEDYTYVIKIDTNTRKEEYKEGTFYENEGAPIDKTIMVSGDSFSNVMKDVLNVYYKRVYIIKHKHINQDLIKQVDPDEFVMEYVERSAVNVGEDYEQF